MQLDAGVVQGARALVRVQTSGVLKVGALKVSSTQVFSVRTLVVSMKRRRGTNLVAKAERAAWVKQRIQCA
jgi:hypothetical protein